MDCRRQDSYWAFPYHFDELAEWGCENTGDGFKILYVPLVIYPQELVGGAAIVSYEIVSRLSRRNRVELLLGHSLGLNSTNTEKSWETSANVLGFLSDTLPLNRLFNGIYKSVRMHPDVVITQYHPSDGVSGVGMMLARQAGCPVMVRSDDIRYVPSRFLSPVTSIIHGLNRKVVSNADLFLVNSTEHRELIHRDYGREHNVIVHPNGVDTDRFNPSLDSHDLRQEYGLQDARVVFYMGSLANFYGLNLLSKAFSVLAREMQDARLVLMGLYGSSQEKQAFYHTLERDGITNKTVILPHVPYESIHHYVAMADMCIGTLASFPENFGTIPTKVPQYMACGKATVVAENGVSEDLITDHETGITFQKGNYAELAEWTAQLLTDRKLNKGLGDRARNHVVLHYSWDALVSQLESLISKCTA